MTFDEWAISVGLGDIEPHSRGDFEDCWNAATIAERERCVKALEVLPWEQAATAEEAIRAGEGS